MSKTVFNYNTPVSAEWFNVINGQRLRFDGNPAFPNDLVDGQYYPIRAQDLDPAILAPYAQSLDIVTTNTDQVINGDKTFTNPISVPAATSANHAITKAQLDAANISLTNLRADTDTGFTTINAGVVKLLTDQTIYNTKTFINSPQVPPASTPGGAVNYAQLLGALPGITQYGGDRIIFPNGLKIIFGFRNGSGGQSETFNFGYTFNNPPIVLVSPIFNEQTVMFSLGTVTNSTYEVWGRLKEGQNITMSNNFIAIGF